MAVSEKRAEYENREGVALETQLMPNAIHTEENPSVILRKGEKFESTTNYILKQYNYNLPRQKYYNYVIY